MISDAHRRVRAATHAAHERLEARADILSRLESPERRRGLVEGFTGLHADAEAALAPWLADVAGLDFPGRRRSQWLARDLAALGGAPPASSPIAVGGRGEALGFMYVLEGSTLGGRLIRRHVLAAGGDLAGLSFLDPYGDAVGERWRSFLAVLDGHAQDDDEAEAMVEGALAGFRHAEQRLVETPLQ